MTSGGRGKRAYHRHIWKACRGGWWAVFFFFYGENVSNFWRNYPLFFQKQFAKNTPNFWGACRQLWRNLYEFVWGIDTSPVLLQYKKWPNKKKKRKRLVMGCDSQLFFFPPPPLIWCLLEMNDDSFRRQCRVEDRKKQHTGRGQTPDSRLHRGEEELVRRLLYIYSRALFSSAPFIACF
jgi:hypothetical protein